MIFSNSEIESLPFPIASILRLYEAKKNPRMKLEHLFHFFEALTEFLSVILLSPFIQDKGFYDREITPLKNIKPNWYKTPSIGDWNLINRWITKSIRRFRENKSIYKKFLNIFCNPSSNFLKNLIDKKIYEILYAFREDRNTWKAHSGILGNKDIESLLKKHTKNLEILKPKLLDLFSNSYLILALDIKYKQGIFNHNIKRIMGPNIIFFTDIINTKIPMEYGGLYLLHQNSNRPIKLLPLIRIIPGPKTNKDACYFYNRIDGNQVRYVSYHYEDDSEHFLDIDDEINDFFSLFEPSETYKDFISPKKIKTAPDKYWEIFDELINKFKEAKPGSTFRSSSRDAWLALPVGTTGIHLEWNFSGKEPYKKLNISIHLENDNYRVNHEVFDFFNNQKDKLQELFNQELLFEKNWLRNGEWSRIFILKDVETLDNFMKNNKLKDWAFKNMIKFYDFYMINQEEVKNLVNKVKFH